MWRFVVEVLVYFEVVGPQWVIEVLLVKVIQVVWEVGVLVLVGELAVGAILALALGKEHAEEVLVVNLGGGVLPVVLLPVGTVVDVCGV